jgi:hypothetical protein
MPLLWLLIDRKIHLRLHVLKTTINLQGIRLVDKCLKSPWLPPLRRSHFQAVRCTRASDPEIDVADLRKIKQMQSDAESDHQEIKEAGTA